MQIPIYHVDAFATRLFAGNPAAVCPLTEWLSDELMLSIAAENNLSETAFLVSDPAGDFQLRWFTPTVEVELCVHATLASHFEQNQTKFFVEIIIFAFLNPKRWFVRLLPTCMR